MHLRKNILLYYCITFFKAGAFTTATWTFFFTQYLEISFSWALFITVLPGVISLFFEVHSGIWADRFWRKKLFIFSLLLLFIWTSFYIFSTQIYHFVIASIILWIWFACNSWNIESLIHDNLEEQKNTTPITFKSISSHSYVIFFFTRAFSVLVWWYLFIISPVFPFLLNTIWFLIAFILAFFIYEPKQLLSKEKNSLSHLKTTFKYLKNNKNILYYIFISGFIFSGFWNIFWFTRQELLSQLSISITYISWIYIYCAIFSIAWAYYVKNILNNYVNYQVIRFFILSLFFTSILYASYSPIYIFIAMALGSIMFGMVTTVANDYIIGQAPKTHKSTLLSIFSLIVTFSYFFFWGITALLIYFQNLQTVYYIIPICLGIFIFYDQTKKQYN